MKRIKLVALVTAAASLLTMGLAGCGNGASSSDKGGTTTITLWHSFTESDGKTVAKIANLFNKSQKKYKITVEENPANVVTDKLLSSLSAGTGPDLVVLPPDTAKGYITQHAFESTDDFYSDSKNDTAVLRKNVVKDGMVDGKHYGVPMGDAPYSVYYNKKLFEKAGITEADYPKTLDDLAKLAQRLTVDSNNDGTPEQYGIALSDKEAGYIPTFLQAAGTDLVVDGKANLTSATAKDTLTWWRDNFWAKKVSPSNISLVDAQSLFVSGKAAMFYIGPWIKNTAAQKNVEIGTFEFPKGSKKKVTEVAANYWYVTSQGAKDANKKKGIYEFLKFFNNRKNQITWGVEANYPPNRTDITSADLHNNALVAQITPYMKYGKVFLGSVPSHFTDVQSELNALGPKISSSTGDISPLLKQSNDKIQSLISQ